MMTDLQIGLVGLEIDMAHPYQITERNGPDGVERTIRGHIKDTTTLAEAIALRHALTNQAVSRFSDGFVAVASTVDSSINGFYTLTQANIELSHRLGSLQSTGFFPFTATLVPVTTRMFESSFTDAVRANDHSDTTGEPFVGLPPALTSVSPEETVVARAGADGSCQVFRDVSVPLIWSVDPANFYDNACVVHTGSPARLRTGNEGFDDASNWRISNGLMRVEATSGGGGGRFTTEMHGGSAWESSKTWELNRASVEVGGWDHMQILYNDPWFVAIRLVQTRTGSTGRHVLDLSLRRGSRFVRVRWKQSAASAMELARSSADSGTNVSDWGLRDSTNDGNGNRWVLGSVNTTTRDTTNGAIERASATVADFFIGYEENGSSAVGGNTAQDLYDQYLHHVAENVRPIVAGGVP